MSFSFKPNEGLIVVRVTLEGPSGRGILRLALDTGATCTMISSGLLVAVGYDPALVSERLPVTTGSGVEYVPRIPVSKISALGKDRIGLPVLCHTLPPSAGVDGLLGLDFLSGRRLALDFRLGRILLS